MAHTEEFYELYDDDLEIAPLGEALLSKYLEPRHPEMVPAQLLSM